MSTVSRTRRTAALGAVLLASVLTASACGSGDDDKNEDKGAAGGGTRAVTDALGRQVTVPTDPKRVVTISEIDLDSALALGVTPVGTVNGRGQQTPPRYLADKIKDIAVVGDVGKPVMDKVLEADPDLIITGGSSTADPALIDKLNQIAPTVVTSKAGADWKTTLGAVAHALNKEDKAKEVVAAYDKKVADTRAKLGPKIDSTVSLVRWNPQGPVAMTGSAIGSQVLADVGLKRPASQQNVDSPHSAPLSLEALNQIDADYLFLGTLTEGGDALKALEQAKASPAYQQLNVVKNNRVSTVDGSQWTSVGGPLAATAMLDDIVARLAN